MQLKHINISKTGNKKMKNNNLCESVIFPKGKKVEGAMASVFVGVAWINMLVMDPEFNCPVYNVTFEPRARNNWHKHPGGQILLVTGVEDIIKKKVNRLDC